MTATYSPAQIDAATGDVISAVRWLLQDINTAAAEVQNEEISAMYDTHDSTLSQDVRVYRTAAALARALHRRFARQASFSSGGTSVNLQERASYWNTVATELSALALVVETGDTEPTVLYARRDSSFGGASL